MIIVSRGEAGTFRQRKVFSFVASVGVCIGVAIVKGGLFIAVPVGVIAVLIASRFSAVIAVKCIMSTLERLPWNGSRVSRVNLSE